MRAFLGSLAALCFCGALFYAAPVPQPTASPPNGPPAAGTAPADGFELYIELPAHDPTDQRFYLQIQVACAQIVDLYFRPVTLSGLYYSAMKGLYEKAGRPVPDGLSAEVEKAKTDKDLTALFRRVRQESGHGKDYNADMLLCFEAVVASLDPYTKIVDGSDQQTASPLQAESDGFGLTIAPHHITNALRITVVLPGGPAQRAGLRPGDTITHLNGRAVKDLSAPEVDGLLGFTTSDGPPSPGAVEQAVPPPRPLEVTYRRHGVTDQHKATLAKDHFRAETVLGVSRFDNNTWNYFVDVRARIAHVRLASLAKGTAQELRAVLSDLRGQRMQGLILDLRWCGGGYLDESVECARLFLDDEKVVTTIKVRKREDIVHRANKEGGFTEFPMVVLVNGDTTGGAELIAAALQDHGRARVGGQRSFGKASVQSPVHLGMPYTGIRLTSGTFERPSGKNLHRLPESKVGDAWGVCPDADLECRLTPTTNAALKEAWLLQTLRPGSSRERLLLDDPAIDAVCNLALEFLRSQPGNKARAKAD
jgi:carboxyl-terminal processing protease